MRKTIALSEYVKRRNGVPLGATGSMSNMFYRSLGAESFTRFWQFWNPIWGYYLGRLIYAPLAKKLPRALAVITTFAVSGALHDLAVMLVKWQLVFFFTPWFGLMGVMVVVTKILNINYKSRNWISRATINCSFVFTSLAVVIVTQNAVL